MGDSDGGARAMEEGLPARPEKSPSTTTSQDKQSPENCHRRFWQLFRSFWVAVLVPLQPKPSGNTAFKGLVRSLESCPQGYPNLAAFLDSDESFMVYRRFGYLQSRLLLDKQGELRALERKLDRMDNSDARENPIRLQTVDLKEEDAKPRRELLKQIDEKFRDYASLMLLAQQLVSFNKPATSDYQIVVNYMDSHQQLIAKDAQWIEIKEDLVTLRAGREHAWLDSSIEHLLKWMQTTLGAKALVEYLFCSTETKQKSQGPVVYYARGRIERVAVSIIIMAILALLVIPIYLLYHLVAEIGTTKAYTICIGVLLVFTLAFSAILSLFTRAQRHEILGAAAAYCAVLVVFLGNVGSKVH